jgi:putative YhbY family RNA-binding protein
MLEISSSQRRELRALAHHLDPVVSIAGNGLSASVLKEIDAALSAHELIKVRVYGDDRDARAHYLTEICTQLQCAAVQNIGKLLVVYRPAPKPQPAARPVVAKPKRAARGKTAAKPAFELRPGRPTTGNAPRKSLAGAPAPRYRKPTAGSSRVKKSAR